MKTCVVIPMKDPSLSKQRLSMVLDGPQRQTLALTLFRQTLRFFNRHFADTAVLVVTGSERVADIARGYGARVLMEQDRDGACSSTEAQPTDGLNRAVQQAANWCCRQGFDSQLLLPADIAELSVDEVGRLLAHPREVPSVVICQASDGGTNALLTTPPDVIPFRFGPRSARAHLATALEHSVPCALLQLEKLTFDVDTPDDLQHWTECLALPVVVPATLTQGVN